MDVAIDASFCSETGLPVNGLEQTRAIKLGDSKRIKHVIYRLKNIHVDLVSDQVNRPVDIGIVRVKVERSEYCKQQKCIKYNAGNTRDQKICIFVHKAVKNNGCTIFPDKNTIDMVSDIEEQFYCMN